MSEPNDAEDYMNDPAVNAAMEDAAEIDRLKGRIEELEHHADMGTFTRNGTHIITNDQIDEAWEVANRGFEIDVAPPTAKEALYSLGIVACEWRSACGHFECRDGETATRMPPENYEAVPVCPDCNGNGWVIEERSGR